MANTGAANPNTKTGAGGAAKTSTARAATAKTAKSPPARGAPGQAPAKRATASGKRTASNQQQGRQGAGPASLRPIRKHQSRADIIASIAADTGADLRTVEQVTRSLSSTLTRHLMPGGSGRVEIPYLGAALWRGRLAARKARTMMSPLLKREVQIPGRKAQPVARLRTHAVLREAVARV